MKAIKLTSEQAEYIKSSLLKPAEQYAEKGHALAIEDVKAIKSILKGRTSKHFEQMLKENLAQIDSSPIFSLTSSDQYEIMLDILQAVSKD